MAMLLHVSGDAAASNGRSPSGSKKKAVGQTRQHRVASPLVKRSVISRRSVTKPLPLKRATSQPSKAAIVKTAHLRAVKARKAARGIPKAGEQKFFVAEAKQLVNLPSTNRRSAFRGGAHGAERSQGGLVGMVEAKNRDLDSKLAEKASRIEKQQATVIVHTADDPEPVVTLDPAGLKRRLNDDWSLGFTVHSDSPRSPMRESADASPLRTLMPMVKLERTF